MAEIKRFEDIEAWQKARELVSAIYAVSSKGAFAKDFGLRDQTRRAAVSVLSNIAEGSNEVVTKSSCNFCLWLRLLLERSDRNCM